MCVSVGCLVLTRHRGRIRALFAVLFVALLLSNIPPDKTPTVHGALNVALLCASHAGLCLNPDTFGLCRLSCLCRLKRLNKQKVVSQLCVKLGRVAQVDAIITVKSTTATVIINVVLTNIFSIGVWLITQAWRYNLLSMLLFSFAVKTVKVL